MNPLRWTDALKIKLKKKKISPWIYQFIREKKTFFFSFFYLYHGIRSARGRGKLNNLLAQLAKIIYDVRVNLYQIFLLPFVDQIVHLHRIVQQSLFLFLLCCCFIYIYIKILNSGILSFWNYLLQWYNYFFFTARMFVIRLVQLRVIFKFVVIISIDKLTHHLRFLQIYMERGWNPSILENRHLLVHPILQLIQHRLFLFPSKLGQSENFH